MQLPVKYSNIIMLIEKIILPYFPFSVYVCVSLYPSIHVEVRTQPQM